MPSQTLVAKRPWRTRYEHTKKMRSSSKASTFATSSRARTPAASSPAPRRQHLNNDPSAVSSARSSSAPSSRAETLAFHDQLSRPGYTSSSSSQASQRNRSQSLPFETDAEISSREYDDSVHEIVMAIDMRNRDTIGCCYYVAAEEKLYLLNDVAHGAIDIFATLKETIEPTIIIVSDNIDEVVDDILDPDGAQADSTSSDARLRLPYKIEVYKPKEFNFEDGKRRLAELGVTSEQDGSMVFATPGDDDPFESYNVGLEAGFTSHPGKLLRLSTLIDLESRHSIGCASAVLSYLQHRRNSVYLPGDANAQAMFRIMAVEMFNLNNVMYLNPDTLASLQIMESESHPHAQNQGPNNTGSKESLSVYGLFHHFARSPQGKQRLRAMFLRPTLDPQIISERHRSIATFLRTVNADHVAEMVQALKSVKNMRPVMIHLRKGISGGADRYRAFKCNVWTTIRAFAYHVLGIQTAAELFECTEPVDIITKIVETFEPQKIALVGRDIENIVDFRKSLDEGRTVISEGVDETLDATRRTYAGIEHLLSQVSEEVIQDYDEHSEAAVINVVTYPQIGFLISVHKDEESQRFPVPPPPRPDRPAWERIFTSEHSAYYKDSRMHALDQRFGDILGNIHGREIELAFELGQRILDHEDLFCRISDICGELDTLLSLAQGANTYRLAQPKLVRENIIDIVGGRHLLQEQLSPNFIPNETLLAGGEGTGADGPSMLMLTGPNYSGKSVYLKQVALIVFLAHVGSFVPAQKATIGITDKILTRISTRETVSRQHSAFMIDLQQISSAVNLCTARSLLVIDEFGKGTEAADGAGLACAVFEHFLSLQGARPKVVAATHFHEIFENGFLEGHPNLACFHLEVSVDRTASLDQQVTYLYELKPGRSVASFGTVCAVMNGIDASIVKRATDIIRLQARGDLIAPHESLSESEKLNLAQAERLGREFLMQDFSTTHGAPSANPRVFLAGLNFDWETSSGTV